MQRLFNKYSRGLGIQLDKSISWLLFHYRTSCTEVQMIAFLRVLCEGYVSISVRSCQIWGGWGKGPWPPMGSFTLRKRRNHQSWSGRKGKRKKEKWILARSSSTSPSACAFSASSGSSMPCTCARRWPGEQWHFILRLGFWMPTASPPLGLLRGSGARIGHRFISGWKQEVLNLLLQVRLTLQLTFLMGF